MDPDSKFSDPTRIANNDTVDLYREIETLTVTSLEVLQYLVTNDFLRTYVCSLIWPWL